MKALVSVAFSMVLATPIAFPDEMIFADGFEAPRSCWAGGGFVGKLDLCFDMPFGITPPLEMDTAEAFTEIPRADLIVGMDTTGSMGGEIANLKSAASTIIDEFLLRSQDGAVSIAAYDDYPYEPYGIMDQGDRAIGGDCAGALSVLPVEQQPSTEYEYHPNSSSIRFMM